MTRMKKILAVMLAVLVALSMVVSLTACGCGGEPPQEPHACSTKCPVCGLCTDNTCYEDVCAKKCGDDLEYLSSFDAVDLKVGKTNVTVNATQGYVEDFDGADGSAIVFKFSASEAKTGTLVAYVSKGSTEEVFTDVIGVTVNGGTELTRPSYIPARQGNEGLSWVAVNLGCIDLKEGSNEVVFAAKGNSSHSFRRIDIISNIEDITIEQANAVGHICTQVCEDCGGCLDFTCLNDGCANKCTCVSGGDKANLIWAFDEHCISNRDVNGKLTGIGATWGSKTEIAYNGIVASEAGTYKYGAVISSTHYASPLFTDQFTVTVNGEQVQPGTGYCPIIGDEVHHVPADFNRTTNSVDVNGDPIDQSQINYEWEAYQFTMVGEMELKEGENTIKIDQDLTERVKAIWGMAYNFMTLVIFTGDDQTITLSDHAHKLEKVKGTAPTCGAPGTRDYYKCTAEPACGKFFADALAVEEIDTGDLELPATKSGHVWSAQDTDATCEVCGAELKSVDVMDDKVIFEQSEDGEYYPAASKNNPNSGENHGYIEGQNAKPSRVILYVTVNKETTASLWASLAGTTGANPIPFSISWEPYVNGTKIESDTLIHTTDLAYGGKWSDFKYEYAGEITLKEGKNKVMFDLAPNHTGNKLNFKAVGFGDMDEGVTLTLDEGGGSPLPESMTQAVVLSVMDDKVVFEEKVTDGEYESAGKNTSKECISGNNGKAGYRITFYVKSSYAGTVKLYANLPGKTSQSAELVISDMWAASINDTPVASETHSHMYSTGSKWYDFEFEYYNDITLNEGVNKIVFECTNASYKLNFKGIKLTGVLQDETVELASQSEYNPE